METTLMLYRLLCLGKEPVAKNAVFTKTFRTAEARTRWAAQHPEVTVLRTWTEVQLVLEGTE